MGETKLKFGNAESNKKEFHASKNPIVLNLVDIEKIIFGKFKLSDEGSKYFIDYKDDNIIRPLCMFFTQKSGNIKCFENGRKNISFKTDDDNVLTKYNKIWNRIKKMLNIKFHSKPAHDEKHKN